VGADVLSFLLIIGPEFPPPICSTPSATSRSGFKIGELHLSLQAMATAVVALALALIVTALCSVG
jgi:hypothetical protein